MNAASVGGSALPWLAGAIAQSAGSGLLLRRCCCPFAVPVLSLRPVSPSARPIGTRLPRYRRSAGPSQAVSSDSWPPTK